MGRRVGLAGCYGQWAYCGTVHAFFSFLVSLCDCFSFLGLRSFCFSFLVSNDPFKANPYSFH